MFPEPLLPTAVAAASLPLLQIAAVVAYTCAQVLVVLYASHRYLVLWRWWRGRPRPGAGAAAAGAALPVVTVQLPVYNESRVVERLIDAAAALDYPPERLEIQVLDDSTDETRERAAAAVERHRRRGLDIRHLHRPARTGFKAGALADGLRRARGELIAVFDADFVPAPDFLRRLVPRFADPDVGMVQARWGHLNRDRSILTAAQAALLDAHFLIEHPARMQAGLFFNFNGTAGMWRRRCIADAGGWSDDTLTEDLDLSYRAQMRGWRFVFDPGTETPSELPVDVTALRSQQRRWTRGAIQTARKLLPGIWRAPLPARVKLEALFHLTGNAAYPLLLALGLLLLPAVLTPASLPPGIAWTIQVAVVALGVLPVCLFLAVGQGLAGSGPLRIARDVAGALILGIGLSVNNAGAAFRGLGGRVGDWERTPKTGDVCGRAAPRRRYAAPARLAGRTELALAFGFAGVGAFAWSAGHPGALPFAALLSAGLGAVGAATLRATWAARRAAAAPRPARAGRSSVTAGP